MKSIRLRVIALVTWLVFFSIISRMQAPIVISNITIGLVFVMAAAVLIIPRSPKVPFWAIVLLPIIALLVTRFWSGGLSGDQALFLASIEILAVAVTTALSLWASSALSEFESAVATITLGQVEKRLESAISGQALIYREVRRARNHQRPLAIVSIGVDEKSIDPAAERMVQEVQRSMVKQYKLRGLSKMLCDELEDCAVIVQDADHYLAVLPETMPEELAIVVERLRQKACNQVGVEIKIGAASLPHDNITFEGLLERATQEMENDGVPQPCAVMEQSQLEQRPN